MEWKRQNREFYKKAKVKFIEKYRKNPNMNLARFCVKNAIKMPTINKWLKEEGLIIPKKEIKVSPKRIHKPIEIGQRVSFIENEKLINGIVIAHILKYLN